MSRPYDAVIFDLLSALLDSWSLWDDVAGDSKLGRQWRTRCLEAAGRTESYIPYLALVAESAKAVGLGRSHADSLSSRWSELTPWPEAAEIVAEFSSTGKIGVITNCSEALGVRAANRIGVRFDMVLTAERAGYYKPDKRAYQVAISEIAAAPERILYVAGSPYDVHGAAAAGMPVYWHNRLGLDEPEADAKAIKSAGTLACLRSVVRPSWRDAAWALRIPADDIDEILSSDDEEYALYNFMLLCREAFSLGIERQDWCPPEQVLSFVAACLSDRFSSAGEDLSAAAGVGFAEHVFDGVPQDAYARIYAAIGDDLYRLCRPWLENWLEPAAFERVERAANG